MPAIEDTLTNLKNLRDELDGKINARRAEVDAEYQTRLAEIADEMADEITERDRLNNAIRALEKAENRISTAAAGGGPRAPRGQNREKVLATIEEPRRPAEIIEATGIGRGSLGRSLKQLVDEGAATKQSDGSYVAATVRK